MIMPQLGEIRKAVELGYKGNPLGKYIWAACPDCKNERWVRIERGIPKAIRCIKCNAQEYGRNHLGGKGGNWKGGRHTKTTGYVYVWLARDDFYYPMLTKTGQVLEHRLVMAKHLVRCLNSWEHVHHKNGIRNDNRIENLELTTQGAHHLEHSKGYRDGYTRGLKDGRLKQIQQLQERIAELEARL